MIAIDTNLLVYAHRSGAEGHTQAIEAIERASAGGRTWGIADVTVSEFWSVVTHPSVPGGPSPPESAAGFLNALSEAGARTWLPRADTLSRLVSTAVELGVQGPRIFDLRIALTVLDHGCSEIWTRDRGFISVRGLRVVHPF